MFDSREIRYLPSCEGMKGLWHSPKEATLLKLRPYGNWRYKKTEEWFDDTIDFCTSNILSDNDEIILYRIYEEFDTSSWSLLHKNTLNILLEANLINNEIYELAVILREKAVLIFQSDIERSVSFVRSSEEWREIFRLCDTIKELKQSHLKDKSESDKN